MELKEYKAIDLVPDAYIGERFRPHVKVYKKADVDRYIEKKNMLLKEMAEALDKLSRLGSEPYLGNSIGNLIAQEALVKYHEQINKNK